MKTYLFELAYLGVTAFIHSFIHCKPRGYSTRNHFNMHVQDSDATLARHIARFDAIATSCGSAMPWQSLNRLLIRYWIRV